MGLDVYFREDVLHALLAAEQASAATVAILGDAAHPAQVRAFRQGYRAALATVAIAFGLDPAAVDNDLRLTATAAGTRPQSRPACPPGTEPRLAGPRYPENAGGPG